MNKNILKLLAVLVMCFMICGVLVACGTQGEKGEQGDKGATGATGATGPAGADGATPHIGDNGNWFIGETDTGIKAAAEDLTDCENHDYTIDEEVRHGEDNKFELSKHTIDTVGCTLWVCVDCGDAYLEWVDHDYTTVVTDPTCTTKGYTTYTCACGYTFAADYVDETPHDYNDVVTNPTCTATGYTTHTCKDCGHSYTDAETEKVPHTWGAWEEVLNADNVCECVWDQPYIRHCSVCGVQDTETKTTPAPGHVYTEYKPALKDDDLKVSDCHWVPMEVAKCDVCGHKDCYDMRPIGNGEPVGHTWGKWTVVTAPTADSEGRIRRECSVCFPEGYADGEEFLPLPKLDKTNYTYAVTTEPTCETTGVGTYTFTTENGETLTFTETIKALGHDYDGATYEITKLPTRPTFTDGMTMDEMDAAVAAACGKVEITCVTCGDKHTEDIPAITMAMARCIVAFGNCLEPADTYNVTYFLVNDQTGETDQVTIEFQVDGLYEHDDKPAQADCKKVDGDDNIYYVYWCEKCEHWIIAYVDPKPAP